MKAGWRDAPLGLRDLAVSNMLEIRKHHQNVPKSNDVYSRKI